MVVSTMIAYTIPTPPLQLLEDRYENLINTWVTEHQSTQACGESEYTLCSRTASQHLLNFEQVLSNISAEYSRALNVSQQQLQICDNFTQHIISQFQDHYSSGAPIRFRSECGEEEIDSLKQRLQPRHVPDVASFAAVEQSWNTNLGEYVELLRQESSGLANIIKDLPSKIEGSLPSLTVLPSTSRLQFGQLSTTIDSLESPSLGLDRALQGMGKILDGMMGLFRIARSVIPLEPGIRVNLDDILPMDIFDSISGMMMQTLLTSSQQLSHDLKSLALGLRSQGSSLEGRLVPQLVTLVESLDTTIDQLFQDYHPPPIDVNATGQFSLDFDFLPLSISNWTLSVTQMVRETQQTVKSAANKVIDKSESLVAKVQNITLPKLDSLDWGIDKFTGAIGPVLNILDTIWAIVVIFDVVYRVETTLKSIFFYIKTTISQLPLLDLRKDNTEEQYCDLLSRIPWGLLGPILTIVAILVGLIIITIVVVIQYVLLYKSYVEGCVTSSNGTFLTNSIQDAATNTILDDSASTLVTWEQLYTEQFLAQCDETTSSHSQQVKSIYDSILYQKSAFMDNSSILASIHKCIDPEQTYIYPNPTSPGLYLLTTDPSTKPVNAQSVIQGLTGECTTAKIGSYPWSGLEKNHPSVQSCLRNIPTCSIQHKCAASLASLKYASHVAGCDSEWYLHSSIIQFILILITTICLNIARVHLMKFITAFWYQHLGTVNLEVLINYKFRTMRSTIKEKDLNKEITEHLSSHRRSGLVALAIAFLAQVPYLFCIFFFLQFTSPRY